MSTEDKLQLLLEHLAQDLIKLEDDPSVSKEKLAQVSEVYSTVYNLLIKLKSA